MPLLHAALLCLHLLAATFWVGGMALMHVAVRPAAVATLEPPLRLPFLAATLGRFFIGVTAAIVVLLASGFGMVAMLGGWAGVHWGVQAMAGTGLLMMALYTRIRLALYPALRRAVAAREWPAAAGAMNSIRRLVEVNLLLGVAVFVLASLVQCSTLCGT